MFNKITIIPIDTLPVKPTVNNTTKQINTEQPTGTKSLYENVLMEIDYENGEKSAFEMPKAVADWIVRLNNSFNLKETYYFKSEQLSYLAQAAEFINDDYFGANFNLCIDKIWQIFYKLPLGDTCEDYDIVPIGDYKKLEKRYSEHVLVPTHKKLAELVSKSDPEYGKVLLKRSEESLNSQNDKIIFEESLNPDKLIIIMNNLPDKESTIKIIKDLVFQKNKYHFKVGYFFKVSGQLIVSLIILNWYGKEKLIGPIPIQKVVNLIEADENDFLTAYKLFLN